jgi:hypothetical protein
MAPYETNTPERPLPPTGDTVYNLHVIPGFFLTIDIGTFLYFKAIDTKATRVFASKTACDCEACGSAYLACRQTA